MLVLQNYKKMSPQQKAYVIVNCGSQTAAKSLSLKKLSIENKTTKSFFPEMIKKYFFPTSQNVLGQEQGCFYLGRMEQPAWEKVFVCIQPLGAALHFYGSFPLTRRKGAIVQTDEL